MPTELRIRVPDALAFLLTQQARRKGAYGGRGAGKSWAFADSVLARMLAGQIRVLCAREYQNTIADSVHRLLRDRIAAYGLEGAFDVTDRAITARQTGSECVFRGLHANATEIKSFEGVDLCWVEEAQKVTQESLDILVPTIRKPGSELWFSWNTGTNKEPVYKLLVQNPAPGTICAFVNYWDNPWFPDVLRQEMEHDKATDQAKYRHVWCGEPLAGGAFFTTFGPHLRERPFVIEAKDAAGRIYGSLDYGWGANGVTCYGHWWLDGNMRPHRLCTWMRRGAGPASVQARALIEYLASWHYSSGVLPVAVYADPSMWTKTPSNDGGVPTKCPADYFVEAGLPLVPANNNRVNGLQVMLDAFGLDALTHEPKMRYWEGFNGALEELLPTAEHDPNRPGDVAEDPENEHILDECRYGLVALMGRKTAAKIVEQPRPGGVSWRTIEAAVSRHTRELEHAGVLDDTGW